MAKGFQPFAEGLFFYWTDGVCCLQQIMNDGKSYKPVGKC